MDNAIDHLRQLRMVASKRGQISGYGLLGSPLFILNPLFEFSWVGNVLECDFCAACAGGAELKVAVSQEPFNCAL